MTVPFTIIRNRPIGQLFINFISVTNIQCLFLINQSNGFFVYIAPFITSSHRRIRIPYYIYSMPEVNVSINC